jgi:hypothetical protein
LRLSAFLSTRFTKSMLNINKTTFDKKSTKSNKRGSYFANTSVTGRSSAAFRFMQMLHGHTCLEIVAPAATFPTKYSRHFR